MSPASCSEPYPQPPLTPHRSIPGFVEARLVGSDLCEDRVLTVVRCGLGCPVVGFELGWWDEPDLTVEAPVVVPVDILSNRDLDVGDVLPAACRSHRGVADALGFEQ